MNSLNALSHVLRLLPTKTIFVLSTALLSAQASNAASQSSSAKLIISYTLTDLVPDDNIAPSFRLDAEWQNVRISNTEIGYSDVLNNSSYQEYVSPISLTSNSSAFAVAASAAREPSVDGKIILEASTFLDDNGGLQGQQGHARAEYSGRYYLSPHTKINFTLDYELTQDSAWEPGRLLNPTRAIMTFSLPMSGPFVISQEGTTTGRFSREYINYASTDDQVFISAYGAAAVTAVPEPVTYGMILAGLVVVGVTIRRRKAL